MKSGSIAYSVIFSTIMLVLTGCGRMSAPTTFFLLAPIADPQPVAQGHDQFSVAVGSFSVAAYLDREQIVTLQSKNEITIDDFKQWAEPLAENMKRVLMENLSMMLQTSEIYDADRQNIFSTDFQVTVHIDRFDVTSSGTAEMVSYWSVHDKAGAELVRKKSVIKGVADQPGVNGQVDVQNRIVADFSITIAKTLASLSSK